MLYYLKSKKGLCMTDHPEERSRIPTAEAMRRTGWSRSYLTSLLRAGTLEGFRYPGTREWFIYVDSLNAYLAQMRKPGPKGPKRPESQLS
jgi:hypothetical protein